MDTILLYSNIILWVIQLIFAFSLIVIFRQFGEVYLKKSDSIKRDGIPIGDEIPNFEANLFFETKTISNESLSMKPSIIVFISATCKPCKELLNDWKMVTQKYRENYNLLLVGKGEEEQFKKLMNSSDIQRGFIFDKFGLFELFNVRVTPFGIITDKKGVVHGKGLCGSIDQVENLVMFLNGQSESIA